ncbi:SDR family oxidoreductase [Streptomyces caelestis]|jgi:NAD(P)-dependent dehydrogenase (short-subunit alcohol dehydrogenase family)|uniref:NAD(P)-dependent dehydrogenase (Short-subunit alcohol dehydrogenase family) n=1 Tax=Streptomyces caelestis TaxID=36816 RepID=A0A7W9HC01_9ACTN|nr:SDR family oxidoreductase [Streptomyces caelestis]MBB5799164.1 NAD(P)-dependent dehydrogenase (short-subunit alcohol dehydrogenase family) [Streptomyces caelestis]GGW46868.1 short-chain dehydrogenase [Streptomyces caelestis]
MSSVLVVGGTSGIGLAFARARAEQGDEVVLTSRDAHRADLIAKEFGARGIALDLARPLEIAAALADVGRVDHLVLAGVSRDDNKVSEYDIDAALRLVTLKLVGYTEVVHTLRTRLHDDSAIVLFGGQAKERPYPGATTVATVNAGVRGLMNSLAVELAPVRVNVVHPGVVGDSPYWQAKPEKVLEVLRTETPTGRLATMADVVDAVGFLLRNRSVNAVELTVDGGWLLG